MDRLAMLEQRVAMLEHCRAMQSAAVAPDPWSGERVSAQPKLRPDFEEPEEIEESEEAPAEDTDDGYDPELDKKTHPVLSDFKNPLPRGGARSATQSARIVLGGGNGLSASAQELATLQDELYEEAVSDE